MNKEDITRMAKEAGFEVYETDVWITDGWWLEELERFAALVAEHEREACAKVPVTLVEEGMAEHMPEGDELICARKNLALAVVIAEVIRARGNT
jgi:hypothetical protein